MDQGKSVDFLRALETFVAVAEQDSMTAAAHSLGITQSAVSQQLRQLEAELGRDLVDRTVRPIALTSVGMVLHRQAPQLLIDAANVRALVKDAGWSVMPNLRIAVIGSLAGTLVPPLIDALTRQLNIERVSVSRGGATTSENALLDRDADMLITSDPLYEVAGLDRFPLFREPLLLALPKRGRKLKKTMSLEELSRDGSFIRYPRHTQMGQAIDSHLNRIRVPLTGRLEFDSPEDIMSLIAAGHGWAITSPSHVLQGMRVNQRVQAVPLPGPGLQRTVSLIVRSDELGRIPEQVHRICARVIEQDFVPPLRDIIPWIGDEFEVLT